MDRYRLMKYIKNRDRFVLGKYHRVRHIYIYKGSSSMDRYRLIRYIKNRDRLVSSKYHRVRHMYIRVALP